MAYLRLVRPTRDALASLFTVLLFTSCQSYPSGTGRPSPTGYWSRGYEIVGGGIREAAQVKQMLLTVAAQTNLPKHTPEPYEYSPTPIAVYRDSRVQLLASRHKDYVYVGVTRYDFSGASAFAHIDQLVRSTLSKKFGKRLYIEPEPDYSHPPIITY